MSDEQSAPLSQDERAELVALRNARAMSDDAGVTVPEPAKELPDEAYAFSVGAVVKFARPDGTTGYGLIVSRAPMNTTTPGGETLGGYVVAQFGPSNDMPATADDLGLEPI
jgi:hypothetical protein